MNLIKDVISILTSLSLVDYILYFSILALIILVAALIYVMKTEENEKEEKKEVAVGSESVKNSVESEIDLQTVVNTIDENPKPLVDMTVYEKEQEQKAIISYEELINESKKQQINYDEEELIDDCIPTKKINLTTLINETGGRKPKEGLDVNPKEHENILFHYEKEEAFLKALQELNKLLN